MSNEQRWMINDALGLLLQLSRSCCLAPVRFVKISTDTFIYMSRPLLLCSVIIASIMKFYTIYLLFIAISKVKKGYYNELAIGLFNICVIIVFVSYAVLLSETRIKNYVTCFTKLERAIRGLQSTEEMNIKKWHVLIMFLILTGGINLIQTVDYFIYCGSITPMTFALMIEFTVTVIVQLQFLYFALYVGFVLKNIKEQLQEELLKIIKNQDGKQLRNFTTACFNIPLESINKAIDMIGMTDNLFPDGPTTERQIIAQRIRQINDSYVLAREVLQKLSSSDGFLLFLLLIYFSFAIVYCSYSIIKLFRQDGLLLSAKLIIQCLELLMLAIRLIMIVEPFHVAHERILKIRFLMCEITCYVTSTNDPVFRVIDGLFHQLVLNDISYTALGICKIGRPLVTSILAVATTILISIFEL